jgi:chromate transporter
MQLLAILAGCMVGMLFFRSHVETVSPNSDLSTSGSRRLGAIYLAAFALLLIGLPIAATFANAPDSFAFADAFYRAGSLVFGGGHVVLPLLESYTVQNGWIDESSFLAGYGAAQALPGPLFAFSAFLGAAVENGPTGVLGGVFALVMIYVPSWLLVLGAMPFWNRLRQVHLARAALIGANAAVVGLLFAALYQPIWTSSITGVIPLAFALAAFVAIKFWKVPPWLVVLVSAGIGQLVF